MASRRRGPRGQKGWRVDRRLIRELLGVKESRLAEHARPAFGGYCNRVRYYAARPKRDMAPSSCTGRRAASGGGWSTRDRQRYNTAVSSRTVPHDTLPYPTAHPAQAIEACDCARTRTRPPHHRDVLDRPGREPAAASHARLPSQPYRRQRPQPSHSSPPHSSPARRPPPVARCHSLPSRPPAPTPRVRSRPCPCPHALWPASAACSRLRLPSALLVRDPPAAIRHPPSASCQTLTPPTPLVVPILDCLCRLQPA